MKFPSSPNRDRLALSACLVLAAALRLWGIGRDGAWEDEAVALRVAREPGPSAFLARLAAIDASRAPLHPMALRGWLGAFGDSIASARMMSAACGIAAVGLVYALGRRAFGPGTARLACLLAAVNPLDVHHSREARMYEPLALAACLCWALLFSFRRPPGPARLSAYSAGLAAMMYLHPLGGLMVAALGVGYLILRPGLRLSWGAWAATQALAALMLAPWLPNYLDHGPQAFPRKLTAWVLLEWPEAFTGGRAEAAWAGAALVVAGLVAAGRRRDDGGEGDREGGRRGDARSSAALLAWFLVPPALLLALTLARHPLFGERRYLLFVGPAYLLLVARGLICLPTRLRVAALLAFAHFNVGALQRRVFDVYRPDFGAVAALAEAGDPAAPIVVIDDRRKNLAQCLEAHRRPGLAGPVVPVARALAGVSGPAPTAWFAIESPRGRPRPPVPEALGRLYATERTWVLRDVVLTYNRLARPDSPAGTARR